MNRIKRARLCLGLTQGQLAERLGVSTVSVCKWETGEANPSPKRWKLIAETLHTSVEDLLEEGA